MNKIEYQLLMRSANFVIFFMRIRKKNTRYIIAVEEKIYNDRRLVSRDVTPEIFAHNFFFHSHLHTKCALWLLFCVSTQYALCGHEPNQYESTLTSNIIVSRFLFTISQKFSTTNLSLACVFVLETFAQTQFVLHNYNLFTSFFFLSHTRCVLFSNWTFFFAF